MQVKGRRRVLFLCTGNSARSILAEAILNKVGSPHFEAVSAGSHPTGSVNPLALNLLADLGYETAGLRSKSWDEFATADARPIDIVITVCDAAASEVCPVWVGHPVTAHWGLPDPAAVEGNVSEKKAAFVQVYRTLQARIDRLLEAAGSDMPVSVLKRKLNDIGRVVAPETEPNEPV
ncbi:MAG: arsenate reductase ArsC [Pseudomonadales bacterium]|nr:arsenate reductase ArsC [Pseudomonadales bacterium]